MRAINLRTEHMINPIGIDSKEPYLSWNCEDGRRQTAYQIVAMDENGVVWDSSRVESDSMHASCPLELKSRQRIFWKIRLWDEKNEVPVSIKVPLKDSEGNYIDYTENSWTWGCQIKLTGEQNGSIQSLNVTRRLTNQRVI